MLTLLLTTTQIKQVMKRKQHITATLYFSGRGQSSADVHSPSLVRWHGTGCRALFATLRPWTVLRRRWRHFSSLLTFNFPLLILILLHALYKRLCTAPLNRLPCYGSLEVIVTLLLLLTASKLQTEKVAWAVGRKIKLRGYCCSETEQEQTAVSCCMTSVTFVPSAVPKSLAKYQDILLRSTETKKPSKVFQIYHQKAAVRETSCYRLLLMKTTSKTIHQYYIEKLHTVYLLLYKPML